MTDNIRKEELSFSYLNAICAYSGISMQIQRRDDDGLDVMVKKTITRLDGHRYNAQLGIQLKSTSIQLPETKLDIKYKLKIKNYNDLTMKSSNQTILALLILPKLETEWINWSINELMIRKCMYWICLREYEESSNSETVTLSIPKANVLSSISLLKLLSTIAEEKMI